MLQAQQEGRPAPAGNSRRRCRAGRRRTTPPRRALGSNETNPETWGSPGRNDPCPCGSGKKFKHCHGRLTDPGPGRRAAAKQPHGSTNYWSDLTGFRPIAHASLASNRRLEGSCECTCVTPSFEPWRFRVSRSGAVFVLQPFRAWRPPGRAPAGSSAQETDTGPTVPVAPIAPARALPLRITAEQAVRCPRRGGSDAAAGAGPVQGGPTIHPMTSRPLCPALRAQRDGTMAMPGAMVALDVDWTPARRMRASFTVTHSTLNFTGAVPMPWAC